MRKGNLLSILIAGLMLIGFATPVRANFLAIQSLPGYINSNDFILSCTSDATSVNFYVSKNGGAATLFATVNPKTSPCEAHVTGTQVNDQTDYKFIVSDGTYTKSTTTIYDTSGPSPVSDYHKDGLSDGYNLHWTNPSDGDFSRVIIYRGDTLDFSADSSHEIATVPGGGGSPMTYADHNGPNWYYDIRAVDKAGNSSSLVGDATGITTTIVTTPTPGASSSEVIILPKEAGQGSVLGTEETPSPTPAATIQPGVVGGINQFAQTTPEPFKWILTHKKISLGILIVLAAAGYGAYYFTRKRK
jgi:hypothetical protein